MAITRRQKEFIEYIEMKTGKKFEGFSFEEACDFIAGYIEESHKPTEKQIKTAYKLAKIHNIPCDCRTRQEFFLFINQFFDNNYIR